MGEKDRERDNKNARKNRSDKVGIFHENNLEKEKNVSKNNIDKCGILVAPVNNRLMKYTCIGIAKECYLRVLPSSSSSSCSSSSPFAKKNSIQKDNCNKEEI